MKYGKLEIDWLGHASFRIKGSLTVYVDPYMLDNEAPKADIIFLTHDHYDHCDAGKIKEIQKPDTVIVCTPACNRHVSGKTEIVTAGKALDVKGVKIKTVPAYNIGKPYHPKGSGVGYVFTIDGTTIYHAGDTDFIPEMNGIKTDIALLPIGGTYTMDTTEAAKAATAIQPKVVIPMHYGTISGTEADPSEFKKLVANPNIDVRILG